MATIRGQRTAIDQILLVVVPFAFWLLLSDRLGFGLLAGRLPGGAGPLLHIAATAAVALLLVSIALAREPDRLDALGLGPMRPIAAFGWGILGLVCSYLASSAAAGIFFALTQRSVSNEIAGKAQWTSRLGVIPLGWVVPLAVFVGIYEEVLFRGFLLGRLRLALAGLGPRAEVAIAVLASSLLFACGHVYQGGLGVTQTFAMGVVLALVAVRTGSVWPCIVAHGLVDTIGLFVLHGLAPMLDHAVARPP